MTEHPIRAGSASQITSIQQVPIIHIATNRPIGYFTAQHLNTRARTGLVFFHNDKAWKILHITEEETVFVLPSEDLDIIIQSKNPGLNGETRNGTQKKARAAPPYGPPTLNSEPIVVESFQNYIVIHTHCGIMVNVTLRLVVDAMLTEQDLIRDSYDDDTRILIQTPAKLTHEEVESISNDLFHIAPREFDRLLLEAVNARFPSVMSEENRESKKHQIRNKLQERMRTKLDTIRSKDLLKEVVKGKIKIVPQFSTLRPTPRAKEFIDEYARVKAAELDELVKRNLAKLKNSIEKENAQLLCLNCLSSQGSIRISDFDEKPKCEQCGSHLLALPAVSAQTIISLLHKKKSSKLNPAETTQLAGTRRTADLVLSYGKRAIIALSIIGIGPQTASTILASMPTTDSEFYYELLKARIHYITTRELWDRKRKRTNSIPNRVRFNI